MIGEPETRYSSTPGKKPASNEPSRNCCTYSQYSFWANIIETITAPHSTMIRVNVAGAPIRISNRLDGTSNAI